MKAREVNVRNRDDTSCQDRGEPVPLEDAILKLVALREERGLNNPFASGTKTTKN